MLEKLSHLYVGDSFFEQWEIMERDENAVGSLLPPLCIHRLGSAVALETGKVEFDAGRVGFDAGREQAAALLAEFWLLRGTRAFLGTCTAFV